MSSNPSSASTVVVRERRPLWRRGARAGLWIVGVTCAVLVSVVGIVHWGVLPHVQQWKPWIEAKASQVVGQPVQMDAIQVSWQGWAPALHLSQVKLLDQQGRIALQLGQVDATLAPAALLAFELRFARLHLDGVHLDVRRDLQGRIRVAGVDTQADTDLADDGRAADWLFAQQEIIIQRGRVRWTDEIRKAPALDLTEVDLNIRNGLLRHQLRLQASPPAAWGDRLTLSGDFGRGLLERRGNWRAWSGTLDIHLPAADVGELGRYVQLPFELRGSRGSLQASLDAEDGDWRAVRASLAVHDMRLRLAKHLEPLDVSSFTGQIRAKRKDSGIELALSNAALTTSAGVEWVLGNVALGWQQQGAASLTEAGGAITGGHFKADRLDLGIMADLASRLPLGRSMERFLKRLAPQGQVEALDVRWSGPPDEPTQWRVKGRLEDFDLPARQAVAPARIGRPGVSGAQADFEFSESGGHADLIVRDGELRFPGIFERVDLPMAQLQARFEWRVQARAQGRPAVEVQITQARFANAELAGELQGTWRTGSPTGAFGVGGYLPGEIALTGQIERADASRFAAYLPVGIPASARRYVGRAVKAGVFENGRFEVKGDVWNFPFNHGQPGVFRVAGTVRDGQFDYLPSISAESHEPGVETPAISPWPGLTQVTGELEFDRNALRFSKGQAQVLGVPLRQVQVALDELGQAPRLTARGEGRGPVSDMLRFVDVTPIGSWLSGALRPMSARGPGELKLELDMLLSQPKTAAVKGSLALNGNDIEIRPDLPPLSGARGRVDFTERDFKLAQVTARALGGDVAIEGGLQPETGLRIGARGVATADGLKSAKELGWLPFIAQSLRGQTAWQADVAMAQGQPEIKVATDLIGMHSDWPAPLGKSESSALPVTWHSARTSGNQLPQREDIRLNLANVAQIHLLRHWGPPGASSVEPVPRIVGGSVGLGQAAAPPEANGVVDVRGRLAQLDLSAWSAALDRSSPGDDRSDFPRLRVSTQIGRLQVAQRQLTQVSLQANQSAQTAHVWQLDLDSNELAGGIIWRSPRNPADPGQVTARLKRLNLPPVDETLQTPQGTAPQQRMPDLDAQIEQFYLRGRLLGRLELRAGSRGAAATSRDWSLEQVHLDLPGGFLNAEGHWSPPARGGAGRMTVNLSMNVLDSARLAAHFGWADAVRGGNGLLQGNLTWAGPPTSPDLSSLEGRLHLALNQGQFLRAEPGGVGRLLGILSLQALPRRLLLDFRDVFQQGFAFDEVSGDVHLQRGLAKTDNLRMRGLQATVLIDGSADLLKETQDLRVLIVPEVNAGAASLAYAAVNPAVGLGTFLAQLLLRDPLRAANTREFVVTGPLADPKVERVERAAGAAPAPRTEPLPAGGAEGTTP